MCNKQLSTGEELYILDEFKFVCKEDYQNNNGKDTILLSGMGLYVKNNHNSKGNFVFCVLIHYYFVNQIFQKYYY